jgi:prepilin-type N-terminal cleavage/methylation domain-containing protein
MRRAKNARLAKPRVRGGFTMLELLIVIGILGILFALGAAAVATARDKAKASNTETLIRKVNRILERQWRAAIDDAMSKPIPLNYVTNAANDKDRARAIWIKAWLRWEFPANFLEATNQPQMPFGFSPKAEYSSVLPTTGGQAFESSACLYLALKAQNRRGVAVDDEAFSRTEVASSLVNGTPVEYLVDGWGRPLTFYRWAIGNEDLNPTPGQAPDPFDPMKRLLDPSWNNPNNPASVAYVTTVEAWIGHPIHQGSGASWTRVSYNTVPVVVSAGKDGVLGLDPVTGSGVYSAAGQDNIYSYRLR